jgi:hypothetical protein
LYITPQSFGQLPSQGAKMLFKKSPSLKIFLSVRRGGPLAVERLSKIKKSPTNVGLL